MATLVNLLHRIQTIGTFLNLLQQSDLYWESIILPLIMDPSTCTDSIRDSKYQCQTLNIVLLTKVGCTWGLVGQHSTGCGQAPVLPTGTTPTHDTATPLKQNTSNVIFTVSLPSIINKYRYNTSHTEQKYNYFAVFTRPIYWSDNISVLAGGQQSAILMTFFLLMTNKKYIHILDR